MKWGTRKSFGIATAILAVVLIVAYAKQVYSVNHSPLLDYVSTIEEYAENCDVPLTSGFYNRGYLKQEGYYANVTSTVFCRVDELCSLGIVTQVEQQRIQAATDKQWIIIVSANFHFEGSNDPLEGVIDLSDYRIVGTDYYFNCSTELNELQVFNKFLSGNSAFSIASGKTIHVELPFLIDTDSVHGVTPDHITAHGAKLLLSIYPVEAYVTLEL